MVTLSVASVVLPAVGVGLGLAGVILGVASLVRRRWRTAEPGGSRKRHAFLSVCLLYLVVYRLDIARAMAYLVERLDATVL